MAVHNLGLNALARRSLASLIVGAALLGVPQAIAVQFSDGTRHFAAVPRLVKVSTTQNQAHTWGGRYYITVSVPEDASEPLGKLEIRQDEGSDRLGPFEFDRTLAFVEGDRQRSVQVEWVELDRDRQTIAVAFNPPIPPGKTLTLGLVPVRTPDAGIYLWGITAFPAGEKVASQFLGYGRLHFYDDRDRSFWR
ncbi:MAG: DUF2808 domain-containing protein [Synechococcales cyanobacterium RU_4_20]|nr:DUF2808 domain-containing protein [Synechococcales cyanobacterium RU_4_20]NJR67632.1 DUF2808 domain-containing protein [Synechococcales cyanobacterium CRU_2_2]